MTATLKDQLALCDTLREALATANALDGQHAVQWGGTYGAVADALNKAIAVTLEGEGYSEALAARYADVIHGACIDTGESVTYCFRLLGQGLLAV